METSCTWLSDMPAVVTRTNSGWVRIVDPLADVPGLAECGLAFTSDTIQFGAARTAHPHTPQGRECRVRQRLRA